MLIVSIAIKASLWMELLTFNTYSTSFQNNKKKDGTVVISLCTTLENYFHFMLPRASGGQLQLLNYSGFAAGKRRWGAWNMAGKGIWKGSLPPNLDSIRSFLLLHFDSICFPLEIPFAENCQILCVCIHLTLCWKDWKGVLLFRW